MKILITGVGGPTPRSFAISLKKYEQLEPISIVGTDVNPLSIGLYQQDLFDKCYVVPPASNGSYWKAMEAIIKKEQIDAAVILPEAEVLAWSKKKPEGLPVKALIPDYKIASLLTDKARMTVLLEVLGLVPASVEFERDLKDFTLITNKLKFPFWVRSVLGTSGLGSLKVNSAEALAQWIAINPSVDRFLASEFLPGRNLACKLLYWEGSLVRAACAERVNYIMAKVAPSGITGNTSFGRLLNEPAIVERSANAMNFLFDKFKIEKHGFFTVDLKENVDGEAMITEINVRHVAFTQCFAAAGANLAGDTIRLLTGLPFDKTFKIYEFEKDLIFLRDVDALPIIMKEIDLLRNFSEK